MMTLFFLHSYGTGHSFYVALKTPEMYSAMTTNHLPVFPTPLTGRNVHKICAIFSIQEIFLLLWVKRLTKYRDKLFGVGGSEVPLWMFKTLSGYKEDTAVTYQQHLLSKLYLLLLYLPVCKTRNASLEI